MVIKIITINSLKLLSLLVAVCLSFFATITNVLHAEDTPDNISNKQLDSLYISETEDVKGTLKILHAEPLYIDLIRDLGAKAGEKEWNFGFGLTDYGKYNQYNALVEYEFAPIDRLGFEIEVPLSIYTDISEDSTGMPSNKIESLKLATQWTFHVNDKYNASFALGYINEFEFNGFNSLKTRAITGNLFNPFLVAAKRWGDNFHSLIYTGPKVHLDYETQKLHTTFEMHTSLHYLISGTRNFIGLETGQYLDGKNYDLVFRPQMRVGIADNLLIGIVSNIPINKKDERFGTFFRLIWEPGHDEK
ncbi:MAG: HAEPLYID family protein [Candidatus Kapaibacteriota bacterium]|jgi:hypothetical protein